MDDIIHCCEVGVSPRTPTGAKIMDGKVVDLSSAMGALVWAAKRSAESEPYCYMGGLVIQPESQAGHRKIITQRLSSRWRKCGLLQDSRQGVPLLLTVFLR